MIKRHFSQNNWWRRQKVTSIPDFFHFFLRYRETLLLYECLYTVWICQVHFIYSAALPLVLLYFVQSVFSKIDEKTFQMKNWKQINTSPGVKWVMQPRRLFHRRLRIEINNFSLEINFSNFSKIIFLLMNSKK